MHRRSTELQRHSDSTALMASPGGKQASEAGQRPHLWAEASDAPAPGSLLLSPGGQASSTAPHTHYQLTRRPPPDPSVWGGIGSVEMEARRALSTPGAGESDGVSRPWKGLQARALETSLPYQRPLHPHTLPPGSTPA